MEQNREYNIGKIYGNVKLLELFRNEKDKRLMAKVECIDCKKEKTIRASDLYNTKTTSCSCKHTTHGISKTKLYNVFYNMKDRCYNPNCRAYKDYGGRGIKICEEWLEDVVTFYNWAMMNGYKEGLSVDRINVDGDYEPNNCRWVTISENVGYANRTNVRRKADKGDYYGIDLEGNVYYFSNANKFAKEHNLNANGLRRVARGEREYYKGWKFGYICDL